MPPRDDSSEAERDVAGLRGGRGPGVQARRTLGVVTALREGTTWLMAEVEQTNPKTGMTFTEVKEFVRNHWEEFINRKNLDIADVNFAPEYEEHGADAPPGMPDGPAGAKEYVRGLHTRFPDVQVDVLDLIAEDDRVVARNRWTGTESTSGVRHEWSGIVIWRIAHRQFVERWAYVQAPQPVDQ